MSRGRNVLNIEDKLADNVSMRIHRYVGASVLLAGVFAWGRSVPGAGSFNTLVDYDLIQHTISVEELRAGVHDERGVNDYFFKVTAYGVANSPEERTKPVEERKSIPAEIGTFGDSTLNSLSYWRHDAADKEGKTIVVEGNVIRELAAGAMRTFELPETQIAVMVVVELYERNKKYLFFGSDTYVAKVAYFPIPWSNYDLPSRTNLALVISDDKGSNVQIKVRYDKPIEKNFIAAKEKI